MNARVRMSSGYVHTSTCLCFVVLSILSLAIQGFFTLFWISLFIWTVRTYIRSIERHGVPLNFQFATMISKDARTVALSDAVLVLSTGICVPFAKAVSKGWIKYYWTGVVIQHVLQTFILFAAVRWTFNRYASIRSYRVCVGLRVIIDNGPGFSPDS